MKLVVEIKPMEDAPSDWRLKILEKLKKAMDTLEIKDYRIEMNALNPYIVNWADCEGRRL